MTLIYELSVVYEHYLPAVILFYFIYFYSFIILCLICCSSDELNIYRKHIKYYKPNEYFLMKNR